MKMNVTDPNMMAEIIRARLWPDVEERYSFPSIPDWAQQPWDDKECQLFLRLNQPDRENHWEMECSHVGFRTMVDDIMVDVFCAWDGDGIMYISLYGSHKSRALLVNTDCKRSYGWERVNQ